MSHAYIEYDDKSGDINQERIKEGFIRCVNFVIQLILKGIKPYKVPALPYVDEYHNAVAFLKEEYNQYKQSFSYARTLQLELPLKKSSKNRLVDAYFVSENDPLGSLKVFLRTDDEYSFLKDGYALMGIHRPQKNDQYHITISVDPNKNIHLEDLWYKLEHLEEVKWKNKYPPARIAERGNWHDEKGKYTIIGSPDTGTEISWGEVLELIWELYNPVKAVKVREFKKDRKDEIKFIHECSPDVEESVIETKKKFIAAKWDASNDKRALLVTPTVLKYFAACIENINPGNMPGIKDLPSIKSFDYMEMPGGLAVIHTKGVFLLDDWSSFTLPVESYKSEFCKILKRYKTICKNQKELKGRIKQIKKNLNNKKIFNRKEVINLSDEMAEIKMELRQINLETMQETGDYNVKKFRDLLEKRWGINTQLEDLYDSVQEIEQIINNYTDTRINRAINNISIYGFPVLLFASLFQFIFAKIPRPIDWFGVHWLGLFLFLALIIIGIKVVKLFLIDDTT
ncbi:hypothetical protein [Natranaerofaba carboxydovora]|uniref:hypothetical protein n=1 Tax=Natranaerofaba carboxydovora TaxID=2742683 RepID=UPI001F130E23|nr:hypothetical protein [Natranaerofaba carboxydovora]UMZ72525.1 hypothetical protein ACONDI_00045 [Natranaerofaba carboxydovora]